VLLHINESIPEDLSHMTFPGRRITFPIVLDDPWSQDATDRYMQFIRDTAVYLPSNVEYLVRNNGLSNAGEMFEKFLSTDWARHMFFDYFFPYLIYNLDCSRGRLLPRMSIPCASKLSM